MDFKLTEEQLMIQQAARDFAQTELLPGVIERDEHSVFPADAVKKMGELGFLGMMVDPKYGGAGLDSVSYVWQWKRLLRLMHLLQLLCLLTTHWYVQEWKNIVQKSKNKNIWYHWHLAKQSGHFVCLSLKPVPTRLRRKQQQ